MAAKTQVLSGVSRRDILKLTLAGSASLITAPVALNSAFGETAKGETIPYEPFELNPKVQNVLSKIPHSVLLYDLSEVERCYQDFVRTGDNVEVHYAVKCAPNSRIISRLVRAGSGFDVASREEVNLVLDAGGDPGKCIYSNTCKFPDDIRYAYAQGIKAFLADSEYEVKLQAETAPGSLLYVRLLVDNKDAAHPLGEKFGTTPDKARELLRMGKKLGLVPYGTHFHVGTQCYSAKAWESPARQAAAIFRDLKKEGIDLKLFDVGGGFPVQYLGKKVPTNDEIVGTVRGVIQEEIPDIPVTIAVEPGRGMVGSAALMSSHVMMRASRPDAEWLHLDVGTYHGLMDALDGIHYPITAIGRSASPTPFTLCGPTCDSTDTISRNQLLPGDMAAGDLVILNNTGAYAECLFSRFNGIAAPEIKYIDDIV